MNNKENDKFYRNCVGMMIINHEKKIFSAERHDFLGAWQMPQGGIEKNEKPLFAAFRELKEETSIKKKDVKLLDELPIWLYYDIPDDLRNILWKGKYKGQKQKWFIFQFVGEEKSINVKTNNSEFLRWKWISKEGLLLKIVDFKKQVYEEVIKNFSVYLN